MAERKRFHAHQPKIGIQVYSGILGLKYVLVRSISQKWAPDAYSSLMLMKTTQTEKARSPIAKITWFSLIGTML